MSKKELWLWLTGIFLWVISIILMMVKARGGVTLAATLLMLLVFWFLARERRIIELKIMRTEIEWLKLKVSYLRSPGSFADRSLENILENTTYLKKIYANADKDEFLMILINFSQMPHSIISEAGRSHDRHSGNDE